MADWDDLTSEWDDGSADWGGSLAASKDGSLSPTGTIEAVVTRLLSVSGAIHPTGDSDLDFNGTAEISLGGTLGLTAITSPEATGLIGGTFTSESILPASSVSLNSIPIGIGAVADPNDAFFGPTGRAYRRVDIYNPDGTIWMSDVPVLDGNVTVDMNRPERRMAELTLDNEDGSFRSDPSGFWYDKVIKIYRGVQDVDDNTQVYQLGEFMIDRISSPNFPKIAKVTCRDYTKKLMKAKFAQATGFAVGSPLDQVIIGILFNAGVTRYNVPNTGIPLDREFYFEVGTERWQAISDLATAFGYEAYFDQAGIFNMRPFVDPTTAPVQFTFFTGAEGNLAKYELSTNDDRIFNHIVVTGTASDILPVYGVAENNEPGSPTNIERLGRRTYPYDSKFIAEQEQAQELAETFLRLMALESYELEMDALVAPWLEAGVAVQFIDPDPAPEAPNRFLLTNFTIPMKVGVMNASAKRVTIVQ